MQTLAHNNKLLFKKNIDYLYRRHVINLDSLSYTEQHYTYMMAKNGEPSLQYNGKTIQSTFNPSREATQRVQAIASTIRDVAVVFGMGLGYILKALSTTVSKKQKVLVVENNPELFSIILSFVNLKKLCATVECHFLVQPTTTMLISSLASLKANYPIVLPNVAASSHNSAQSSKHTCNITLENTVRDYALARSINYATLKRFKKRWISNILSNINRFSSRMIPVSKLRDTFCGIPCIICSAGPTLDDEMAWLVEQRTKFLVIAVDTALNTLYAHNIYPDIAIVADPQYINSYHLLSRSHSNNTLWVADLTTHPSSLQLCKGQLFINSPDDSLCNDITHNTSFATHLESGGSVSTIAWELASLLGCTTAVNLGLDLGFPKMSSHAHLSFFEQNALLNDTKLQPFNTELFRIIYDAPLCLVKSNNGHLIISDTRMKHFRTWFNRKINEYKTITHYAKSPHSSAIKDLELWDDSRVFELPDISLEIHRSKYWLLKDTTDSSHGKELEKNVGVLMHTIQDYRNTIQNSADIAQLHEHSRFIKLAQHPALKFLEFYLQDTTLDILSKTRPSSSSIQNWIDESASLADTILSHGVSAPVQCVPVQ